MLKKSEIYKLAQYCVAACVNMDRNAKLEVLRELMAREDVALFTEKEKDNATV